MKLMKRFSHFLVSFREVALDACVGVLVGFSIVGALAELMFVTLVGFVVESRANSLAELVHSFVVLFDLCDFLFLLAQNSFLFDLFQ